MMVYEGVLKNIAALNFVYQLSLENTKDMLI